MPRKVILHIHGEEPIVGDMEGDPNVTDQFVRVSNCRRRDGKDVASLEANVESVIYPWHRITFIEMMPSDDDQEDAFKFFR